MTFRRIDIIPDIHGDLDRLKDTLRALGYVETSGWAPPDDRMAVFLGDLIDRGLQNLACLKIVSDMIDAGHARAIMGNHELNALLYHTPDGQGGYLRAHGDKENLQHRTFLDEAPVGSFEARLALDFMLKMPMFLEGHGIRLVHAFWGDARTVLIRETAPDAILSPSRFVEVAEENTEFGRAVKDITGGPQVDISEYGSACHFHDGSGFRRTKMRYRWWRADGLSWEDIGISLHEPYHLPDGNVPETLARNTYPGDAPLVVFGHYQRDGDPRDQSGNAICLDFPASPCAYRFNGEREFREENLLII
jgi:hypothetical protein